MVTEARKTALFFQKVIIYLILLKNKTSRNKLPAFLLLTGFQHYKRQNTPSEKYMNKPVFKLHEIPL